MFKAVDYVRPKSIDEAHDLFVSNTNSQILGGGTYLYLSKRTIQLLIDLQETSLKYISQRDGKIRIGAMSTLSDVEESDIFKNAFNNGLVKKVISDIWSYQLRNAATVGGTVYSRLGFSEFLTLLAVLDVDVVFHNTGVISIKDFLKMPPLRDILKEIVITENDLKVSFQVLKRTHFDFPVLSLAVARCDDEFRIAVGSRPGCALLVKDTPKLLSEGCRDLKTVCDSLIREIPFADDLRASSEYRPFADDLRASSEYRRHVCGVLFKRALSEVL